MLSSILGTIIFYTISNAQQVLRYRQSSCNSLEPVYVIENWQYPAQAGNIVEDQLNGVFQRPRRSRDRSPPFRIVVGFDQYRRNREYTVMIECFEFFDAFMLQARSEIRQDGNVSLVGEFTQMPDIATHVTCQDNQVTTVADKGRPVRLGNLTFTWKSPMEASTSLRFVASVVAGGEYHLLQSKELAFNSFPSSISGCGQTKTCYRECSSSPTCPVEDSTLLSTISIQGDEAIFNLGGMVENEETFIGIGLSDDRRTLMNLDLAVCYREGNQTMLKHYMVENRDSQPYEHRSELMLERGDIDTETMFIWCQFRRSLRPGTIWDLDLTQPMFQFYLRGNRNSSGIFMPERGNIKAPGSKTNLTNIINYISFSGGVRAVLNGDGNKASVQVISQLMITLSTLAVVFYA